MTKDIYQHFSSAIIVFCVNHPFKPVNTSTQSAKGASNPTWVVTCNNSLSKLKIYVRTHNLLNQWNHQGTMLPCIITDLHIQLNTSLIFLLEIWLLSFHDVIESNKLLAHVEIFNQYALFCCNWFFNWYWAQLAVIYQCNLHTVMECQDPYHIWTLLFH